jgi:GNAT superfamily N-acetyltransferase
MTNAARRVQAYEATLVSLTPEHIDRMHELAMTVGWSHRAEDLTQLLAIGEGVLAIDAIGRVIGSAMWFRMGQDLASIGMVMTVPPLRSSGVGRWLTEEALAAIGDRKIRMVATREAFHLDYSLGFRPVATVRRFHGHLLRPEAAPAVPRGVALRPMAAADRDALITLDARANAGRRAQALAGVIEHSHGVVAEQNGEITGFALRRPYGRGHLIGPLEAMDEAVATALAVEIVRIEPEGFLRIDLLHAEGDEPPSALTAFVEARGMVRDTGYTLMTLNAPAPVIEAGKGEPVMYAMMNQSLG